MRRPRLTNCYSQEEAVGQADCPFSVEIKGDKEVGRQRSKPCVGHLSGALGRARAETMGTTSARTMQLREMCLFIRKGKRNVGS